MPRGEGRVYLRSSEAHLWVAFDGRLLPKRGFLRTAVIVCLLVLAIGATLQGQTLMTDNAEAARLLALENAWNQAELKHDARALDLLLAETFVYTDSDGSFLNRTRWLAHVRHGDDHYALLANENQTARVYGETAVVTGIYREEGRFGDNRNVVRRGRFTDTWIKQNGAWRCVASQATLLRPSQARVLTKSSRQ